MPIAAALAALAAGMAKLKSAVIVLAITTGFLAVGTAQNSKEIEKLQTGRHKADAKWLVEQKQLEQSFEAGL